ncbi:hypothetical protein [Shewanella sedimentimangrovi]|uniref:hypothetical protein n=1 Tax=Shewanella sedimentimangrovi TaxID=2814293 RepID=UPI001E4435FF|nr:hypothetical protein [Shewanella sedimentimangrovi]
MKLKTNLLMVTLIGSLLGGCATVQYQMPPPVESNVTSIKLAHSELLSQTAGTLMHLNDAQDILYQQNFGGGGMTVGLLFGPLGVAANAAAISSATEEDVKLLKGKLDFDPKTLFTQAVQGQGQTLTDTDPQALSLSPYIYVTKTDEEQLLIGTALIVETHPGQKSNWVGKYMYQTELKMAKADMADGISEAEHASLQQALTQGFDELVQLFLAERQGGIKTEQAITFVSDFVSPRFKFEMVGDQLAADADRVNIRTVGGVYSLPKDAVELKAKAEPKKKVDSKKTKA